MAEQQTRAIFGEADGCQIFKFCNEDGFDKNKLIEPKNQGGDLVRQTTSLFCDDRQPFSILGLSNKTSTDLQPAQEPID